MKIKDLIAAVRDYPALRQALEESNTELDLSRMECAQLQSKINELEPLSMNTTRRAAVRNMPPIRSARKWKH